MEGNRDWSLVIREPLVEVSSEWFTYRLHTYNVLYCMLDPYTKADMAASACLPHHVQGTIISIIFVENICLFSPNAYISILSVCVIKWYTYSIQCCCNWLQLKLIKIMIGRHFSCYQLLIANDNRVYLKYTLMFDRFQQLY